MKSASSCREFRHCLGIGIDVSKAELVVVGLTDQVPYIRRVENRLSAIRIFLSGLQSAGYRGKLLCESTGHYHLKLALVGAMEGDGKVAAASVIALTSKRNLAWVSSLGLYQQALAYEELSSIDASIPTVIVDMSGNGKVLSDLHAHLGDNMRYCSNVGITHYAAAGMGPGFIAARSAMFFAPTHIQKRGADWGPGVFQQKAFLFWQQAALRSREWLQLEHFNGTEGMVAAYTQTLAGSIPPAQGVIVSL